MIIDISQEVFSCKVFPGDPAPAMERIKTIGVAGSASNLTAFSMCAHNGTHVDAPLHFVPEGAAIDAMGLEPFVGDCYVGRCEGEVTAADGGRILSEAKAAGASERILIAGHATVTEDAARVFAAAGIRLIGNESQTFGPDEDHKTVHCILLGAGVALLEGIVLRDVDPGRYFLGAAPLNLGGCEGAPVRAYLIR